MASNTSVVPFDTYTPRVAIVTGASRGIGRAIVLRLADDGIDVAVNDITAQQDDIDKVVEEVRRKGRRAIAVPGDVSVEADVASFIETTVKELGTLDIMIANAGIFPTSLFIETSLEKFKRITEVNVLSVFLCFKFSAIQMIKQGHARNYFHQLLFDVRTAASSITGKRGAPNMSDYSASKFAVRGLVQSASLELQSYGITVNGYAPGLIMTPGLTQCFSEEEIKGMNSQVPVGKPESIASAVSYLVKPESYFISGQTINICGAGIVFD